VPKKNWYEHSSYLLNVYWFDLVAQEDDITIPNAPV
jgi:hypothetical protein